MKQHKVIASSSPVTTIRVSGKAQHYFHSEALGACRAILISPDENLPRPTELSKGDKLEEESDFDAEAYGNKDISEDLGDYEVPSEADGDSDE